MSAKKILELCLSPDLGGLELYMVRASHYLNAISIINKNGKLEQYYQDSTIPYFKIGRLDVLKLARIIDAHDIDVVHLHWTKDIPIAVLAKLLSRKNPKLIQTRNMTMTRFKDDFYHRFLYKNIDKMLAVTYQVKEQIEKFIPADIRPKVDVLYMGAEQPTIINEAKKKSRREQLGLEDSFTVGLVGRIEPEKGQYILIDAIEKLIQQGINARALIVGHAMSEEYLEILQKDIVMRGLQERIIFTGFTREAQTLMQLCDVMVLATKNETFGLVLIEAMMCGVCVLASDSGGPLEIIDDGINGLHFKTLDAEDLTDKLVTVALDEKKRNIFAITGQSKAMKIFESKNQFKKLAYLLEEDS